MAQSSSNSAKLTERIDLILSALEILPLETPADHQYAALRHHLTRLGTPIGPNDLVVVTANVDSLKNISLLLIPAVTSQHQ